MMFTNLLSGVLSGYLSGGGLTARVRDIFKDPPAVESLKLGTTTLQKCIIVPNGQVPENGKADFFKRLEACLARPLMIVTVASPQRQPQIGDTVRCFAVFECQSDKPSPCSSGDRQLHFDVQSTNGADDDRLGHYHLWDICNGKDVYKKYGSNMYLYMCHGHDLQVGDLHFDMFDMTEYTHCGAPVLKARGVHLYLFYEWYKHPNNRLGQGRWVLGEKAASSETLKVSTLL